MDNNIDELNELFALPIKTRPVTTIDGIPLFTSDSLIKATLKTLEKAGASSNYYPQIEKMVNEGIIVPVFLTKGIFSWVTRNLFRYKVKMGDAFAFYYFKDRKIYILMDNSMTKWGTAKNEQVAATVVHECMHLIANRKPKGFYRVFMPYLIKYYTEVYAGMFELKEKDTKDITEIIKFIRSILKSSKSMNAVLTDYAELLTNKFKDKSALSKEQFQDVIMGHTLMCKFGLMDNVRALEMVANKYRIVIASLYYGYSIAFGKRPSMVNQYQELFDLTEVASQYSELFPKSSVVKKIFRLI